MKKKILIIVTSILLVISCSTCIFLGYRLITDNKWSNENQKYLKSLDTLSKVKKEVKDKEEELNKLKEDNKEKAEVLESWKKQAEQVKQG